ncbi:hypothetical protein GO491_00230 [Flavobacteriaceae bacterium Ap0902]|nr:hypothetical protein [Flavobacteriaceae bacterium Ap0902]
MKSFIYKILSFIMAVMVLLTTTSFMIDAHYCGDSLVDISILNQVQNCGMNTDSNSMPCKDGFNKSDCCKDIQVISEGQNEAQISVFDLTLQQQIMLVAFVLLEDDLFIGLDKNIVPFKNYRPPLLEKDIQKTQEVYII